MRRTDRFLALLTRLRQRRIAALPLVGLLAAVGPLAMTSGSTHTPSEAAEVAYRSLPDLPIGSADLEASAVALAASLGAVPLDALGGVCEVDDLTVSWSDPGDRYTIGAHVTPIGPAPDEDTTSVNGIVVCGRSTYAYMGFEARWEGDRWDVIDVPYVGHEEDEDQLFAQPAPLIPQGPKPVPVLAAPGTVTGPIEGYAAYEPQRTCDPTPKVGTRALAGALLRDYPGSRNLGIVRGCSVGGRSEHKEGRAFDWGVNIANPNEKAAADAFIGALMATDSAGNRHALARRMGVMYLIWDRQIWSAFRASEGWRPYTGSSAHRDHVHISLSWAGANGRTSFWSGTVPPDLPTASPVTANVSSRRGTTGSHEASAPSAGGWGGSRRQRGESSSPTSWPDAMRDRTATGGRWDRDVDWGRVRDRDHDDESVHDDRWDQDAWDEWRAEQAAAYEARAQEWARQRAAQEAERQRRQDEAAARRDRDEPDWRDDHDDHDDRDDHRSGGGWGNGGNHGGRGGRWPAPTTTVPRPTTTTTTVPKPTTTLSAPATTSTTVPSTTTTAAPTTTTTTAATTTTTTSAAETTTTTAGG